MSVMYEIDKLAAHGGEMPGADELAELAVEKFGEIEVAAELLLTKDRADGEGKIGLMQTEAYLMSKDGNEIVVTQSGFSRGKDALGGRYSIRIGLMPKETSSGETVVPYVSFDYGGPDGECMDFRVSQSGLEINGFDMMEEENYGLLGVSAEEAYENVISIINNLRTNTDIRWHHHSEIAQNQYSANHWLSDNLGDRSPYPRRTTLTRSQFVLFGGLPENPGDLPDVPKHRFGPLVTHEFLANITHPSFNEMAPIVWDDSVDLDTRRQMEQSEPNIKNPLFNGEVSPELRRFSEVSFDLDDVLNTRIISEQGRIRTIGTHEVQVFTRADGEIDIAELGRAAGRTADGMKITFGYYQPFEVGSNLRANNLGIEMSITLPGGSFFDMQIWQDGCNVFTDIKELTNAYNIDDDGLADVFTRFIKSLAEDPKIKWDDAEEQIEGSEFRKTVSVGGHRHEHYPRFHTLDTGTFVALGGVAKKRTDHFMYPGKTVFDPSINGEFVENLQQYKKLKQEQRPLVA